MNNDREIVPVDRVDELEGMLYYQWSCGCGRNDGYRRADRLGRLPVTPNVTGWTLVL